MDRNYSGSRGTNGFRIRLLERARAIVRKLVEDPWNRSPVSMIKREIALTLEEIEESEKQYGNLERSLVRSEASIGTEMMQLSHEGHNADYSIDPRDKVTNKRLHERLSDRMGRIEQERRRIRISHIERLKALYERLLVLLERYAQIES